MFHGRHHISMLPGVHVGVMSALLHVILLLLIIIMMLLVMLLVVVVVVLALLLAGHHRHASSAGRCCPILLRVFNSAQHGPRVRAVNGRPLQHQSWQGLGRCCVVSLLEPTFSKCEFFKYERLTADQPKSS